MKDKIVERLIDQGHIVIQCADRILNHKGEYLQDIEDLHRDGNISTSESITLLKKHETFEIPFGVPNQTFPIMPPSMPYQPPFQPDWTWDPNRGPMYTQTSTSEKFEYSDTKWPGDINEK